MLQAVVDIRGNLETIAPETVFDLGKIITGFTGTALVVAGAFSFGFFVWGGVMWVAAGGDKGKIEQARERIVQALIGLTITASAYAVFKIIGYLFGIDIVI